VAAKPIAKRLFDDLLLGDRLLAAKLLLKVCASQGVSGVGLETRGERDQKVGQERCALVGLDFSDSPRASNRRLPGFSPLAYFGRRLVR
jgi:hypothetical protein